MSTIILDENSPHDGTIFKPFDESRDAAIKKAASSSKAPATPSIDTSAIDEFRQGVEITTEIHRLKGLGAKLWAGNIEGYTNVITIGQSLPFAEFEGSIIFEELPEFDPVAYIKLGPYYPLPIIFNEGPQQNKETNIQPLTIPYRNGLSTDIDGKEKPHSMRGSLEDGNQNINKLNGHTSRIEQFIPFETDLIQEPFLDEGQEYFGEVMSGSVVIEGYVWEDERTINPYNERSNDSLIDQLNTTDENLIKILKTSSSLNLDDDIREVYGRASATAGGDVYGPQMSRTGTDSLAYRLLIRGS